jgi:hypothetical protein
MMDPDMYLKGIEHCAEKLPQTLREWHTFDDVLQDEYMEQINWFIEAYDEQCAAASQQGLVPSVVRIIEAKARILNTLADWARGRL